MPRIRSEAIEESPVRESYYTTEAKEKEMIGLAYKAAEKQLRDGSASSQIISHFLKLGTVREELELEKLRRENELLSAKKVAIESAERMEALYAEAIRAMSIYNGQYEAEDEDILDGDVDSDLY